MNPFVVAEKITRLAERFEELAKAAPEIRSAIQALSRQAKIGDIDPKHLDVIRRGLFTDRMTGHVMGNQAAYEDFQAGKPKGGVHIRMDANDFGTINKWHGFETGNQAIQSMAQAIRSAVDEAVGKKRSKLFRIGGDEFHLHVPDHASAARFARAVRSKLDSLAPVGGTHRLSLSMGFGPSPAHAEKALIEAKKAKKAKNYAVGQAEHHVHSLVPGFEGPVPASGGPSELPLAVR